MRFKILKRFDVKLETFQMHFMVTGWTAAGTCGDVAGNSMDKVANLDSL